MKIKGISKRFSPFHAANGLVMLILCFTTLYPVWYILINSLLQSADALRGASLWWPKSVTLDNYYTVFHTGNILNAMLVSVLRAPYCR